MDFYNCQISVNGMKAFAFSTVDSALEYLDQQDDSSFLSGHIELTNNDQSKKYEFDDRETLIESLMDC